MANPDNVLQFRRAIRPVNEKLRTALTKKGVSQSELHRRTGVSQPAISGYLRDDLPNTLATLRRLAASLDVNLSEIRAMLVPIIDVIRPFRGRLVAEFLDADVETANERAAS